MDKLQHPYEIGGYPSSTDTCGCDEMFIDYMAHNCYKEHIFQFGTGLHHGIGLQAYTHRKDSKNQVYGITISTSEHEQYARLLTMLPGLDTVYRVLLTNIYALTEESLPNFNTMYLPHMGEYVGRTDSSLVHSVDDESLLKVLMHNKANTYVFWLGSIAWKQTKRLLMERFGRRLRLMSQWKDLLIYKTIK